MSNRLLSAVTLFYRAPKGLKKKEEKRRSMIAVQVHNLYQIAKGKVTGFVVALCDEGSHSLSTHYSAQFSNREFAQLSSTAKVSSRNSQFESRCCHASENIRNHCGQRAMAVDASKVLFYHVISALLGKRFYPCYDTVSIKRLLW